MYSIAATIQEENTGPQVANLYAAVKFLIDKNAFSFIDPSELNLLKDQLRSEEPSGFYRGAAVKLVVQLKVQSGLGDEGIVGERTADALIALLKKSILSAPAPISWCLARSKTHASARKPASSSSPSTAICAIGRNWGAPRPTQRASSRSRIDTSPFAKQRA